MIFNSIHGVKSIKIEKAHPVNSLLSPQTHCLSIDIVTIEGMTIQLSLFSEDKTVLETIKQKQ